MCALFAVLVIRLDFHDRLLQGPVELLRSIRLISIEVHMGKRLGRLCSHFSTAAFEVLGITLLVVYRWELAAHNLCNKSRPYRSYCRLVWLRRTSSSSLYT